MEINLYALIQILLGVALLLVFIRVLLGPKLVHRIIALDLMGTLAMIFFLVLGLRHHNPLYFDIAIVLAIISFIGTVSFSLYLEKKGSRHE